MSIPTYSFSRATSKGRDANSRSYFYNSDTGEHTHSENTSKDFSDGTGTSTSISMTHRHLDGGALVHSHDFEEMLGFTVKPLD